MDHNSMIAVIAAERDGKAIELCSRSGLVWHLCVREGHSWDFDRYKFRIAEPRWRLATIDDLRHAPLACRVRHCDDEQWLPHELTGYSVASGKVMWQTSDFFWHTQCQVLEDE